MHGDPWAAMWLYKMAWKVKMYGTKITFKNFEDFIRAERVSRVPAFHIRYYFTPLGVDSESDSDSN